jgi:hypothetical protein
VQDIIFYHNHSTLGGGKKALTYIRVPETIHKINVLAWGHLQGLKRGSHFYLVNTPSGLSQVIAENNYLVLQLQREQRP